MVLVKSAVRLSNTLATLYLCESGFLTLGTIKLKNKIKCPTGHVHSPYQTNMSHWPGSNQETTVFMCLCLYKIKFKMKLPVFSALPCYLNVFTKYMHL